MKAKNLKSNPILLLVYTAVAVALVINIFVAGYWFGRNRQLAESLFQSRIWAKSSPVR